MKARPKKVWKPKVNARLKSSYSSADIWLPDIAVIGLEELVAVCEAKGLNAFIVDWKDLKNVVSNKWKMNAIMSMLVNAVITPNDVIEKPSSTVLLKKYSDFSYVFDEVCADKLSCHSEHNLAIETKKDKQLLFDLTWVDLLMLRPLNTPLLLLLSPRNSATIKFYSNTTLALTTISIVLPFSLHHIVMPLLHCCTIITSPRPLLHCRYFCYITLLPFLLHYFVAILVALLCRHSCCITLLPLLLHYITLPFSLHH